MTSAQLELSAIDADLERAVPPEIRLHVKWVALTIAEAGAPFTFAPTDAGHRNVKAELSDGALVVVSRHPGILGNVARQMQRAGILVEVGRARLLDPDGTQRRRITLWQKPT